MRLRSVRYLYVIARAGDEGEGAPICELGEQLALEAQQHVTLLAPMIGQVARGVLDHPDPDPPELAGAPVGIAALPCVLGRRDRRPVGGSEWECPTYASMSPPMSLSCSRAAVHASRPTDYVTSGRRPQLLRSIQHLRSRPFHSWTPPRCPLPIAHVRSIPPHREGGPHRMATLVGCGMRARSSSRVHIGGHLGTTETTWPTGVYGGEVMAFAGSWECVGAHWRATPEGRGR